MTKHKILTILVFTMSFLFIQNQGYSVGKLDSLLHNITLKQANKSYKGLAYIRAIELYEKLVRDKYVNAEIYRKLASSYYKIGDSENAEVYYDSLMNGNEIDPGDMYNYAQVLKSNGKYSLADIWIKQYASINTDDTRAKKQLETAKQVDDIKADERYEVEAQSFNSKYSDFGPAMYQDRLLFASARKDESIVNYEYSWNEAPYLDLFEVSLDGALTRPKYLKGKVNTKFHDGPACFSADGTELFFTRNSSMFGIPKKGKEKVANMKIFYAKIINGEIEKPVELNFNSLDYSCGHPSLSADGNTLYFTSDRPGGFGGPDIYYCTRSGSGWSEPVNMGSEINTEGEEMFPFIHQSGQLYFASTGHLGLGGLDLFIAKKNHKGKYEVKNMGYPINTEKDDFSLILDDSGINGYFASNRDGGKGDDDIYKVRVLDQVAFNLHIQGNVLDAETGERIEFPRVVLNDDSGNPLRLMASSDEYDYRVEINPEKTYVLKAEKDEYTSLEEKIDPKKLSASNNEITHHVKLKKLPVWGIYGMVYMKETMKPIPNVSIHIEDIKTNTTAEHISDEEGLFRIKLDKDSYYKLLFEQEGLFAIRAEYTTLGKEAGWVNTNEFVELAFEKVELNKTIEIPNIYYDLGKWDIRPDAAVELDKVVQFLMDNPNIEIELGAHTDSRGNAASNQRLSQRRAQSAVNYIVNKGIANSRITAKGYGESMLKNHCKDGVNCSKAEHQENRRTEIRITGI